MMNQVVVQDVKQLITNWERSYNNAVKEQVKLAFAIGSLYWNAKVGENYAGEALKWFQIVYNLSVDLHLPEKDLLSTCEYLRVVYLHLNRFNDAIIYQNKYLEIAKNIDDKIEQYKGCRRLSWTYNERFLKSKNDDDKTSSLRKAKKYTTRALKLAKTLKENNNNSSNKDFFVELCIDTYFFIGIIEVNREKFNKAEKYLTRGLNIWDEENMDKNNEICASFHHDLGRVYMELGKWDEARQHIDKEIEISRNTGHRLGQARGFFILCELHYRLQDHDAAALSNQKAMEFVDDENVGFLSEELDLYGPSSYKARFMSMLSAHASNNK